MGKVRSPWGLKLKPWGHLVVVVKYVVAPKEIILDDLVTCTHMWIKSYPHVLQFYVRPRGAAQSMIAFDNEGLCMKRLKVQIPLIYPCLQKENI